LFNRLLECASSASQSLRNPEAGYQLSLCYFYGIGVEKDDKECFKWLADAAIGGHQLARLSLRNVYQALNQDAPKEIPLDEWLSGDRPIGLSAPAAVNCVSTLPDNNFKIESFLDAKSSATVNELTSAPHSHISANNPITVVPSSELNFTEADLRGESALFTACKMGNAEAVIELLKHKVAWNNTNQLGTSSLHWLFMFEEHLKLDMIGHELISQGYHLESSTEELPPMGKCLYRCFLGDELTGGTPLSWAVATDSPKTTKFFLGMKADPWLGLLGAKLSSAIVIAVLQQQPELLESLIRAPIVYPNPYIPTERILLARMNQWVENAEQSESLLSLAIKSCQDTFLHMQRFGGFYRQKREKTIRILIRYGSNPRSIQDFRQTALSHAVQFADLDIVKLIIEICGPSDLQVVSGADRGFSPLQWTVHLGKRDIFEYLLELGGDVGEKDEEGKSLLQIWAEAGRQDFHIAERILDLGVGIDDLDYSGVSPLWAALSFGHIPLASFLRSHGADTEILDESKPDEPQFTMLADVIAVNSLSCLPALEFLLRTEDGKKRANCIVGPHNNSTVFHLVCMRSELKEDNLATRAVMHCLLDSFGSIECINSKRTDGFTALHFAVIWGNHVCAEMLLARGADVNAWAAELKQTPVDVLSWRKDNFPYRDEKAAYQRSQKRHHDWEVYRQDSAASGIEWNRNNKYNIMMKYDEEDYLLKLGSDERAQVAQRTLEMEKLLLRYGGKTYNEIKPEKEKEDDDRR